MRRFPSASRLSATAAATLALALLASVTLLGACSATDDFGKFKFVDDGGAPKGDMSGGDMATAPLPGFGEACADSCAPGSPLHPLMCVKMLGPRLVPGNDCTHSCNPGTVLSCPDTGDAVCGTVEGVDVCLEPCNLQQGKGCRTGFSCCANQNVTNSSPGACAPTNTDFCGH